MAAHSLVELETAICASWSRWTSDPVDHAVWSAEPPARGQCAVTARVVQDLLGGELHAAEVARAGRSRQYHLLSATVRRRLDDDDPLSSRPDSSTGVCVDSSGRVLLCLTERRDDGLPRGRPDLGEPFPATLERETREEGGLGARADRVLSAELLEVAPGACVDIVSYACRLVHEDTPPRARSETHRLPFSSLPAEPMCRARTSTDVRARSQRRR